MGVRDEGSARKDTGHPRAYNDLYLGRVLPLINKWLLCRPEVVGI